MHDQLIGVGGRGRGDGQRRAVEGEESDVAGVVFLRVDLIAYRSLPVGGGGERRRLLGFAEGQLHGLRRGIGQRVVRLAHGQRRAALRCGVRVRRGGVHRNGKGAALRDGQLAGLLVISPRTRVGGHGVDGVSRRARLLRDGKHPAHGNDDPLGGIGDLLSLRGDRYGLRGRLVKGVGDAQRAVLILHDIGLRSVHRCGRAVGKGIVRCRGRNDRGGVIRRISRRCGRRSPCHPAQGDIACGGGRVRIERRRRLRRRNARHRDAADGRGGDRVAHAGGDALIIARAGLHAGEGDLRDIIARLGGCGCERVTAYGIGVAVLRGLVILDGSRLPGGGVEIVQPVQGRRRRLAVAVNRMRRRGDGHRRLAVRQRAPVCAARRRDGRAAGGVGEVVLVEVRRQGHIGGGRKRIFRADGLAVIVRDRVAVRICPFRKHIALRGNGRHGGRCGLRVGAAARHRAVTGGGRNAHADVPAAAVQFKGCVAK